MTLVPDLAHLSRAYAATRKVTQLTPLLGAPVGLLAIGRALGDNGEHVVPADVVDQAGGGDGLGREVETGVVRVGEVLVHLGGRRDRWGWFGYVRGWRR
mgnify:CR=1 FL=1